MYVDSISSWKNKKNKRNISTHLIGRNALSSYVLSPGIVFRSLLHNP